MGKFESKLEDEDEFFFKRYIGTIRLCCWVSFISLPVSFPLLFRILAAPPTLDYTDGFGNSSASTGSLKPTKEPAFAELY